MAMIASNISLLLDLPSPRLLTQQPAKNRATTIHDIVLTFVKKDRDGIHKVFEEGEGSSSRSQRDVVVRGKANSRLNGVEENGNGNGNGEEDEEEEYDWEKVMRKRLKEIEEMRELEKKAEELQSKVDEEEVSSGEEQSEEEKRMRVRKELEKVYP